MPGGERHTSTSRVDAEAHLRTRFAAEPVDKLEVPERIAHSIADGELIGPDGKATSWDLHACRPGTVRPDEVEHAERRARS